MMINLRRWKCSRQKNLRRRPLYLVDPETFLVQHRRERGRTAQRGGIPVNHSTE